MTRTIKNKVFLAFLASITFLSNSNAFGESDKQMQEEVLKARESGQNQVDHSSHMPHADKNGEFRGVFYGYLPCADCDGIKYTLSLKHKNNYLLITQYARQSSREIFEKGKYTWDDTHGRVTLTPRDGTANRIYKIKDVGTLIQLNADGAALSGDEDRYALKRSDLANTREMHIH